MDVVIGLAVAAPVTDVLNEPTDDTDKVSVARDDADSETLDVIDAFIFDGVDREVCEAVVEREVRGVSEF